MNEEKEKYKTWSKCFHDAAKISDELIECNDEYRDLELRAMLLIVLSKLKGAL